MQIGGQKKKFCHEICFSKWRRHLFKYEIVCDNCKKEMKNVEIPLAYHYQENDQHFQYCGYICFLSFKEILSYNLVKANRNIKSTNLINEGPILCLQKDTRSIKNDKINENIHGLVNVSRFHKRLQNRIKMMNVLGLLNQCNLKFPLNAINAQR